MNEKLAIIGIDSLDPYILLKYQNELPTFSKLIENSDTLIIESTFPVDSIPAWATIYTGLNPGNHGCLYSYDVFDPTLSDLRKVDSTSIRSHTFWDIAGRFGYRSLILFPMFLYPTWEINGAMVCKSPFDKKLNNIQTTVSLDFYPANLMKKYNFPDKLFSIWGGYPGKNNLNFWANFGYNALKEEYLLTKNVISGEKWDILHIYFSLLDIIQHRLWRFFDKRDPFYHYDKDLNKKILDFYRLFDEFIADFIEQYPDAKLIVISDHGHSIRPINTININELLRQEGYLISSKRKAFLKNRIKFLLLDVITKFDLEDSVIKLITSNGIITKKSKIMYSSNDQIENHQTIASLSSFAGIKSYSYGGIEINRSSLSDMEYLDIRQQIIEKLKLIKNSNGMPAFNWVIKRENLYNSNPGTYCSQLFPDIVFELQPDYCVGWNLHSNLFEKSYDHKVASGGHAKEGVLLLRNINKPITKSEINIVDIAPSILDLCEIPFSKEKFDGDVIF